MCVLPCLHLVLRGLLVRPHGEAELGLSRTKLVVRSLHGRRLLVRANLLEREISETTAGELLLLRRRPRPPEGRYLVDEIGAQGQTVGIREIGECRPDRDG